MPGKLNGRQHLIRQYLIVASIALLAGVLFFTGINWGLPCHDADAYLFGGRMPWTGQQIMQLAGSWETETARGADVAMHLLQGRNQPVIVNDTDAKRAEIVRRYRLYSNQPDEMITFRSLSRMKPAKLDFDPALYQYGGLWIYPVGAILKLGSVLHLITLRSDLAYYLDHPEQFGRFYLAARGYSAAWGIAGVFVVFALGVELSGSLIVGAIAAGLFFAMPVVIDLAHEAKPHLAGTVLTLLAILNAARYVRTGCRWKWILTGGFAGAAMGMVLTGYVAFAVIPVMTLLRPLTWKKRLQIDWGAGLVGLAIFTLTNPYVPYNLLFHRQVLHSNLGNTETFYSPALSAAGLLNAGHLLIEGMSVAPLVIGLAGMIVCGMRRRITLAVPASVAVVVLIQFVLLDRGKPAEYARFAVTFDVVMAIFAAMGLGMLSISDREKGLAGAMLIAITLFYGMRYDINFIADSGQNSTRNESARAIAEASHQANILAVSAEPAPYCLPPVDLFHWQIVLEPRETKQGVTGPFVIGVRAVDQPAVVNPLALPRASSPISWANKPFEISNGSAGMR